MDNINENFEPYHIRRKTILDGMPIPGSLDRNYCEKIEERTNMLNDIYNEVKSKYDYIYEYLFSKYEEMRAKNNPYINLDGLGYSGSAASLVYTMRKYDIRRFVIADMKPGANKRVWWFVRCGCVIEGMVEINGEYINAEHTRTEKIPGFLLRL